MLQIQDALSGTSSARRWRLLALGALALWIFGAGCRKREDGNPAPADSALAESAEATAREEAAQLIAEFDADNDSARRIEIVFQLAANGSGVARAKLDRLYHEPPEPRLKIETINALTFLEDKGLDFALELLRDATGPQQSPELREAALETLRDLDNPRTLPLWRSIVTDADPEIRETATQAIEYLEARQGSR